MYTSVMLLALSQAIGALIPTPNWQDDYKQALKMGEKAKKPLAIFIAAGKDGWKDVSKEKELSLEVRKLLTEKYVCLYVDTDAEYGQRVAKMFEAKDGPAVVISDRHRSVQAFRRVGAVKNVQLALALEENSATPKIERAIERRSSFYQPSVIQSSFPCRT